MTNTIAEASPQIRHGVLSELQWDTRVVATNVSLDVTDGIVTLTGTVSNDAMRLAAQEAAHRVPGVLDVVNNIVVRPARSAERTDTDLALAIRRDLEHDVLVPAERIGTTVSNGMVTLEGEVETLRERENAERVVRHIAGVVGVVNDIQVRVEPVTPHQIQELIELALEAEPQREPLRIGVVVHEGMVTLRGSVRSGAEKRAAVEAARHAPWVRAVHDELRVRRSA
jgi:osmotically-inducible protein OsmY